MSALPEVEKENPKAKLKLCQHEYQESAISGSDGVRAQSKMLGNSANMPTPPNTKAKEKVLLSQEVKGRAQKATARRVPKEPYLATLAEEITCNVIVLRPRQMVRAKAEPSHKTAKERATKETAKAKEKAKVVNLNHHLRSKSANIGMQVTVRMAQAASTIIQTTANFG